MTIRLLILVIGLLLCVSPVFSATGGESSHPDDFSGRRHLIICLQDLGRRGQNHTRALTRTPIELELVQGPFVARPKSALDPNTFTRIPKNYLIEEFALGTSGSARWKNPVDKPLYQVLHGGVTRIGPLDSLLDQMTNIGGGEVLAGTVVLLQIRGRPRDKDAARSMAEALVLSAAYSQALKGIAIRARPDNDPEWKSLWTGPTDSFPSGHAAAAWAAAEVLGQYYPRRRAWFHLIANLVALSRVSVEAHYPTDVLVGYFLGRECGKLGLGQRSLLNSPPEENRINFGITPMGITILIFRNF
ncbi:MAG: phosphatase PAP2 family protein [Armatimonadetes bacterium]|nr:phosphatase PAP2 family protein [Armatimonadota bacterium]